MKRTPLRPANSARRRKLYQEQFGEAAAKVRQMACVVCLKPGPSHPHHVKSRGAGGKSSDLVPICANCHGLIHHYGRKSFELYFEVDLAVMAADIARHLAALPQKGA